MFAQPEFDGYALLDSGGGEKLERFGAHVLRRPDPQALWRPHRAPSAWEAADLTFVRDPKSGGKRGTWHARDPKAVGWTSDGLVPWSIGWRSVSITIEPTPFKHVGVFPEQAANWDLIERAGACFPREKPRLLNLFGYTGTASIVAARAGFSVVHVDASKTSLRGLEVNLQGNCMGEAPVRILLDDALTFARREVRRGSRYSVILLDPPHHGRGPRGEVWQFEEHLAPLIEACGQLLEPRGLLVLSTYAIGFSPLAFTNLLSELEGGRVVSGELALAEQRDAPPARHLPAGYCARFARGLDLDLGG